MADPRAEQIARIQQIERIRALEAGQSAPIDNAQSSPETPLSADLFGSDSARTAASFGDLAGVTPLITKQGYSNIQKNKAGDIVAKAPNGQYYKDISNITGHPLNWLESHAGPALPFTGMAAGAGIGSAITAPSGPAALGGGMIGAGVGASGGEYLRSGIGKLLNTYKGGMSQINNEAGKEGLLAMPAEVLGQGANKVLRGAGEMIPLPGGSNLAEATGKGLNYLYNVPRNVVAKLGSMASGVDKEAMLRTMTRPNLVMQSGRPGNVLNVMRGAQNELENRASEEGGLISLARKQFSEKYGRSPVNTEEETQAIRESLSANQPNDAGHSGMQPSEFSELNDLHKGLHSNVLSSEPMQGARVSKPIIVQNEVSPEVRASDVEFKADPFQGRVTVPGQERVIQPAQTENVTTGYANQMPMRTAGDLQKTTDYLQREIPNKDYQTVGPTRSPKSVGLYQRLLGMLKEKFHNLDPSGLGAADARFADYANKVKLMGPLENNGTGESFTSNLFGKNKGARQEAAQDLIPKSYEDMADIGALKSFSGDKGIQEKLGPTSPAVVRIGLPLAAGTAVSHFTHNPTLGAMTLGGLGALSLGTTPTAMKYGMLGASRLLGPKQISPWLLMDAEKKLKEEMDKENK